MPKTAPAPAPLSSLIEQHSTPPSVSKQIEIAQIDEAIQVRTYTDDLKAEEYAEIYRADKHGLPPIVLFEEPPTDDQPGRWYVADGNHRLAGARLAKLREIDAIIKPGTRRDALLYAISEANHHHGLPLTNADKRAMVIHLLTDEEWRQWSDREIARRCHVSAPFVGKLRPTVNGAQTDQRKSKDGRTRSVDNIGKAPRAGTVLTVIASEIDCPIPTDDPDHKTIRVVTQDELERISDHTANTVSITAKARHARKPAKISPVQIGTRLYVVDGSHHKNGQTTQITLVPIVSAETAKTDQFRADVIERAAANIADLLGLPLTWKGAPEDSVAGTCCDALELMNADAFKAYQELTTPGDDETAADQSGGLAHHRDQIKRYVGDITAYLLAEAEPVPHETKLRILAALLYAGRGNYVIDGTEITVLTRQQLADLVDASLDVHPGQLVRAKKITGTGEDADPYALTFETESLLEATLAAAADHANDEPETLGPATVADPAATVADPADDDEEDVVVTDDESAAPATTERSRDQRIRDHLADYLDSGKIGRLSLHQAAALTVVLGIDDNSEIRYGDSLISNVCYELSKAVADQLSDHLRDNSVRLRQLPPLPDLCALFGADYGSFLARANAAQEG